MTEPGEAEVPLARVLGPVRLPAPAGGLVPPPGSLPTRLVVALALAGSDGRSIEGLALDVWPDDRPRNPRAALQMLVSRTRAVAAEGLLLSSPAGYRLTSSDLAVAERAARNGGGDTDAALALWSGTPGADVDVPELADELAARADRARVRLLTLRATALLRTDPLGALEDLEELTAARPLDAEPQRLRMRALAAAGRTGEALASFAEHRERLAQELGTDPDPALVELNAELLRDGTGTGTGTGTGQLIGVRAAATRLLGREEDIRRLTEGVPRHRLTSIVGTGGLGKTRLAHEVSAALAPRFPRVLFVELAGAREDADVALVIGAAAGARGTQARRRLNDPLPPDLATRTREALGSRPTLLVLDNCEQVIDAVAASTADLLATVPTLTVLTTTRMPLLLQGEHIHALQPLDTTTDAVELFLERAAAARPDARLDPATVARICAHLDGLPLAIELAAARLRSMTLDELDQRLSDRFTVLVGGDRTAPERHRTLFAVIDWSWQLLTPESRDALRMLAVFPDGFTTDGASTFLRAEAAGVLSDLVDQSLLTFSERPTGRGRYRMLETVREFGLRALEDAGEVAEAERALDRFALAFCRRVAAGLTGGIEPAASRETATEEETLLMVLRGRPEGREPVVLAVFALLAEFWIYRGEFERIPDHLPAALAAGARRPTDDRERDDALRALTLAGTLAILTGSPAATRALALLRRARKTLDPDADGFWATFSGALFARQSGEEALAELEQLTATSPDPLISTFTSLLTGQLYENSGRIEDALAASLRTRRLAERFGLTWFRLVATMSIAQLHSQRADREEGLRLAVAAVEEITALDLRTDAAQTDWIIAANEVALGRLETAEARFTRLAATEGSGRREDRSDNRAIGLAGLAEVAAARGDTGALEAWAVAGRHATASSVPWRIIVAAAALAATARLAGPADPYSATLGEDYQRLRGRVLALTRFSWEQVDVPVLASGVLGLAAVLLRADRSPEQQRIGAELVTLAVPLGARLDFPALEAVPGVREVLADGTTRIDRASALGRIATLLRLPAARL